MKSWNITVWVTVILLLESSEASFWFPLGIAGLLLWGSSGIPDSDYTETYTTTTRYYRYTPTSASLYYKTIATSTIDPSSHSPTHTTTNSTDRISGTDPSSHVGRFCAAGLILFAVYFGICVLFYFINQKLMKKAKYSWDSIELAEYADSHSSWKIFLMKAFSKWTALVILLTVSNLPFMLILHSFYGLKEYHFSRRRERRSDKNNVEANGNNSVSRSQVDNYAIDSNERSSKPLNIFNPNNKYCSFSTVKDFISTSSTNESEAMCCIICLGDYQEDLDSRKLKSSRLIILPCEHHFHFTCFLETLKAKQHYNRNGDMIRCPICSLNLLRVAVYYEDHDLDPANVPFKNKE